MEFRSPPRAKGKKSRALAIVLSIAAHAAVIYAVYETKFVLKRAARHRSAHDHRRRAPAQAAATASRGPKPLPVAETPAPRPLDLHQTMPVEGPPPSEPLPFWPPPVPLPLAVQARRAGAARAAHDHQPQLVGAAEPRTIWPATTPTGRPQLGSAGNVLLQCLVTAKGRGLHLLGAERRPAEFGFGDAALKLSGCSSSGPARIEGQAIEGAQVKIPIAFRIG